VGQACMETFEFNRLYKMSDAKLEKILLVEDAPDIQLVARIALEKTGGFTVEVCSSGIEALEKAEAFGPDLILLDVMMPGLDGPSTLRSLREFPSLTHTPVIFMTAKVQPQEIAQYVELGALNVIAKPFDPMGLAKTVREIWETGTS